MNMEKPKRVLLKNGNGDFPECPKCGRAGYIEVLAEINWCGWCGHNSPKEDDKPPAPAKKNKEAVKANSKKDKES